MSLRFAPGWLRLGARTERDASEGRRAAGAPRIGVLAPADATRGLWRDAQCLLWALRESPERPALSVFCGHEFRKSVRTLLGLRAVAPPVATPEAVDPSVALGDWLRELDHLVILPCVPTMPARAALAAGVHVVHVPHLDWATSGGSVERWVEEVADLQRRHAHGFEVWAKTPMVATRLASRGIEAHLVPWSIPDPVRRGRRARDTPVITFLVNAGRGGWRSRRGADLALRAFAVARESARTPIQLTLKAVLPCRGFLPASAVEMLARCEVEVIERFVDRAALADLHADADAVLYPSRWEGFGLSLLEALHEGLPVLATDGDPMNELVEDGATGLLIHAEQRGLTRLAAHWECDVDALTGAMVRLADEPALRAALTGACREALAARQDHFRALVRARLLGTAP